MTRQEGRTDQDCLVRAPMHISAEYDQVVGYILNASVGERAAF